MSPQVRYKFRLPIEDRDDLRLYLDTVWGVRIPDVQVCPNHSTPWRAFCDAYFAPEPVTVWEGSRGFSGKTYSMGVLGIAEATALGADSNILGGSGEQSKRVLAAMQELWGRETAPRHLLLADPMTRTTLTNGCSIVALMASQASVRGPHPPRLRVDEVDELDLPILDAALGQTMTKPSRWVNSVSLRPNTLLSSTHQYPDGTMSEVKRRATAHGFPYHAWCYRETLQPHGWLTTYDVEAKRKVIPAAMWETEYELQEPSPTNRAIMTDAVRRMFRKDLGVYKASDQLVIFEPPQAGGRYSTGADWAKAQDKTAIITLRTDRRPYRVVAYQAVNRQPWPTMVGYFERRLQQYGKKGAHDGTGLGDVVDGYLKVRPEPGPIILVGQERKDLFSDYIGAIERGEVDSPWFELMEYEHRTASIDALFGSGHPPDTFVAGALAYRAAKALTSAFAVA